MLSEKATLSQGPLFNIQCCQVHHPHLYVLIFCYRLANTSTVHHTAKWICLASVYALNVNQMQNIVFSLSISLLSFPPPTVHCSPYFAVSLSPFFFSPPHIQAPEL